MEIGDTIDGKYKLIREVGAGGMGIVYEIQDITTNATYALKCCTLKDRYYLKRFEREVSVMEKVQNKNLISILGSNLQHDPPYFIMPLAKGNVGTIINKMANNFEKVMGIFKQICNGIIALHANGIYHRDIKPANFLVLPDGSIVVSDLGLVKDSDPSISTFTQSGQFLGTRYFAAPEQANGKYADARTDVYLLGKSFYIMYTGDIPILFEKRKLTGALYYILTKATENDPNNRYQTVSEFLDALLSYQKSLNPSEAPRDAIKNKLLELTSDLQSGNYNDNTYLELMQLIENNENGTDLIIESFNKIPNDILKVIVTKQLTVFTTLLNLYTEKLLEYYQEIRPFAYTDLVAEKMVIIFNFTSDDLEKSLAIKNILRVAVWHNRFYAINVFYTLLQTISNQKDAEMVAVILNEEINLFEQIAEGLPIEKLHPIIRDSREIALNKNRNNKNNPDGEDNEWIANSFA